MRCTAAIEQRVALENPMEQESPPTWLRHVPAARWLAGYQVEWLPGDAVAGATLAAYAIPVSLAYAALAGLPPQAGIYGYLLGGVGYALLGSSRQLAIGPTSAISLMIADTVAGMADGDAQRYAQIASLAAMMVALFCLVAWLLRLSMLVRLISDSILVGFKAGAGLTIAMTQLPSLLGVAGGGHNFFERAVLLAGQLGHIQYLVLALGVVAILLLVLGERLLPARPVGLAVVALAIVVAWAFGLAELGVPTTGEVPAGLPSLELPGCGCATSKGLFHSLPAVCCLPTSKAFPRRARSPPSMGMASTRGGNSWALVRPTSRLRWDTATPSRVACRSRQSTTRQARALRWLSFLPPAPLRSACCFLPGCWPTCRRRCLLPSC
jgi:sulfate permease, SulP family